MRQLRDTGVLRTFSLFLVHTHARAHLQSTGSSSSSSSSSCASISHVSESPAFRRLSQTPMRSNSSQQLGLSLQRPRKTPYSQPVSHSQVAHSQSQEQLTQLPVDDDPFVFAASQPPPNTPIVVPPSRATLTQSQQQQQQQQQPPPPPNTQQSQPVIAQPIAVAPRLTEEERAEMQASAQWRANAQDTLETIARKLELYAGAVVANREQSEARIAAVDERLARLETAIGQTADALQRLAVDRDDAERRTAAAISNAANAAAAAVVAQLPPPPPPPPTPPPVIVQAAHDEGTEVDQKALLEAVQCAVEDVMAKATRKRERDFEATESRLQEAMQYAKREMLDALDAATTMMMRVANKRARTPPPMRAPAAAAAMRSSSAAATQATAPSRVRASAISVSSSEYRAVRAAPRKQQRSNAPPPATPGANSNNSEVTQFRKDLLRQWWSSGNATPKRK